MSEAAQVLRAARLESGLTQAELAQRLDASQAAIARLERAGANPTVSTLRKALRATGHRLELSAEERRSSVDLPQLIRHMRMSPEARLAAHQLAYENMRKLTAGQSRRG